MVNPMPARRSRFPRRGAGTAGGAVTATGAGGGVTGVAAAAGVASGGDAGAGDVSGGGAGAGSSAAAVPASDSSSSDARQRIPRLSHGTGSGPERGAGCGAEGAG